MMSRQPLSKAIHQETQTVRLKLDAVSGIKKFATEKLKLPKSNSYTHYVSLDREYPVWVVVAARPLSLEVKQWCYVVIGCASYRGYFSEEQAEKYAQRLRQNGWETDVGGAVAYSTLGWFSDPVFSSMLTGSVASLAELLFHEMAHQRVYIKGNSSLNEAFATLIGIEGARAWLRDTMPQGLERYETRLRVRADFAEMVHGLKTSLAEVYSSSVADNEKLASKQQLIRKFREQYQRHKTIKWNGTGYYDEWVESNINNAKLAAFTTYNQLLPDLLRLFESCDRDYDRFYKTIENGQWRARSCG